MALACGIAITNMGVPITAIRELVMISSLRFHDRTQTLGGRKIETRFPDRCSRIRRLTIYLKNKTLAHCRLQVKGLSAVDKSFRPEIVIESSGLNCLRASMLKSTVSRSAGTFASMDIWLWSDGRASPEFLPELGSFARLGPF